MSKVKVKVVIGANYGDEGKGLATRYFSRESKSSCLNVLYNGGPQRGHTVELKNGIRHVFHHFGSGTIDGANTYFDRDFMVNPMVLVKERNELSEIYQQLNRQSPQCYISPICRITTPYDMFINQIVEINRSGSRHGSCGFGIWETQKRYEDGEFALSYGELIKKTDSEIIEYFRDLSRIYLPNRLLHYGISEIPKEYKHLIDSYDLALHYLSDLREMQNIVEQCSFDDVFGLHDCVVFEGGQGLALDEDNEIQYPHVTASKTTSVVPTKRIMQKECDVEICYVTRTYFTRHGAGQLPTECNKEEICGEIKDETNVHNDFQGSIRYGHFDKVDFFERVIADSRYVKSIIPSTKTSLFLTHVNYTGERFGNSSVSEISTHFDNSYISKSKYAEDVKIK